MPSPPLVAKLGGSLLDWDGVPTALGAFLRDRGHPRPVLVVGGGAIVEILRRLDRIHQIGESRSHDLALRAMDLTARAVAAIFPGPAEVVERIDVLPQLWDRGTLPIFAPRRFLELEDREAPDPLPHRWDVTSDSIAARLAVRLGAEALVLLKSASARPGLRLPEAAALGLVDPAFPDACRSIPRVSVVNLRESPRRERILHP